MHRASYNESDGEKITQDEVRKNFGWGVTHPLPIVQNEVDEKTSSETMLATPDFAKIGNIVEIGSNDPDEKEKKEQIFYDFRQSKTVDLSFFTDCIGN